MNKTVTINLQGSLFTIEEDAYEELKGYLDSIKQYFSHFENQEDVIEDIEARISEQLSDRNSKERKNIVVKEDIEILIKSMGTVEDIAETNEENKEDIIGKQTKRLYRDEEKAIIAGVCSGISEYLAIDPVWIRLFFLASIFFGGTGVLLYVIFWIAMPQAKTPTERMEMRGESITLAGVQETVKSASKRVEGKAKNFFSRYFDFVQAIFQRILLVFGSIIKRLGKIIAFFLGIAMIFSGIISIIGVCITASFFIFPWGSYYINFPLQQGIQNGMYLGIIVAALLTLIIPLVFSILLGISVIRKRFSLTFLSSFTMIGIWIMSIISLIVMSFSVVPVYDRYIDSLSSLPIITREYTDSFEKVHVRDVDKITLIYGTEPKVQVNSTEMSLQRMSIQVIDGQLNIEKKGSRKLCIDCDRIYAPIELEITTPNLSDVNISGANKIIMDGFSGEKLSARFNNGNEIDLVNIDVGELDLDISDVTTTVISGNARLLSAVLSGYSGDKFQAFGLSTEQTVVDMSNSNISAEISVSDSLKVLSTGRGSVIYRGEPKITEEFSQESLENLSFEYNGISYPVVLRKVRNGDDLTYEVQVDSDLRDDSITLNVSEENYTAQVRVNDEYDKIEVYDITKADVQPPSIVEKAK